MWLFTPDYFVSAVVDRKDPEVIHVRARCTDHLVALLNRHGPRAPNLADSTIFTTPDADYPCRIAITRDEWADIVHFEAVTMTESNHKNAAATRGFAKREHQRALHDVWASMHLLTPRQQLVPPERARRRLGR